MNRIMYAFGASLAIMTAFAAVPAAQAMGSGNPYLDQQVGVSYTVYQPSYTAGLNTPTALGKQPACPKGTEQSLNVSYGAKTSLQFVVTQGNPMCADISTGPTVLATMIMGSKATVKAYCEPAKVKACTRSDVAKHGGQLSVTLPATKGLRKTMVWIETSGARKLTAHQLVLVARSMKPVS